MRLFAILLTYVCLTVPLHAAEQDVPRVVGKDLKIDSPEIWTPGESLCISGHKLNRCYKVTRMGEIDLRKDGEPVAAADQYVKTLPPDLVEYLGKYSKMTVRYLSVDKPAEGMPGFIVQIFFSVLGSGTQAIYVFGDYNPEANVVTPTGYLDTGAFQYQLRSLIVDDQKVIQIGMLVTDAYLKNTGPIEIPKN